MYMENKHELSPELPIRKEGDTTLKEKYSELEGLFLEAREGIKVTTFYESMQPFWKMVKEKYRPEECIDCLLWHLTIGSSPNETVTKLDLPGGEIENFIRNELPKFANRK